LNIRKIFNNSIQTKFKIKVSAKYYLKVQVDEVMR